MIHYLRFCALYISQTYNVKGYSASLNAKDFRKFSRSERGGSHLEWMASLTVQFCSPCPLKYSNSGVLIV